MKNSQIFWYINLIEILSIFGYFMLQLVYVVGIKILNELKIYYPVKTHNKIIYLKFLREEIIKDFTGKITR